MLADLLTPHNHLLALARRGRLRWLSVVPEGRRTLVDKLYPLVAIMALPLMLVGAGVLTLVPALLLGYLGPSTDLRMAAQLVLQFGAVFLLLAGWLWLVEARPLWTIGFERAQWLRKYLRGAGLGLLFMAGAVAFMALPGYVALDDGDPGRRGWAALGGVLVLFLGWLVQGAAEEAVARGFLLPVTGLRWGAPAGIAVSSLVFAALHGANPNGSPVAALNLVLVSVFLALYALHEGGLWGVCAFHSVWNWAQGNLFGFEVSGTTERWSMLLDLRETGPDVITGGPFGPEGGLAVTVMLTLGIVGVAVAALRRQHAAPEGPPTPASEISP